MINNTSFAHWDRLKAKTLDAQFSREMIAGLNCSPIEAEVIVAKVHEIYTPLWNDNPGPKPGQIQMVVVDASVAPNVPLAKAKQRVVTLTLQAAAEDLQFRRGHSVPALRQRRLCRMAEEASSKGGYSPWKTWPIYLIAEFEPWSMTCTPCAMTTWSRPCAPPSRIWDAPSRTDV